LVWLSFQLHLSFFSFPVKYCQIYPSDLASQFMITFDYCFTLGCSIILRVLFDVRFVFLLLFANDFIILLILFLWLVVFDSMQFLHRLVLADNLAVRCRYCHNKKYSKLFEYICCVF
jgi:hypothetical protein